MAFLRHKIGLSHVELGYDSCSNYGHRKITCGRWVGFEFKDRLINDQCEFPSITGVVFFMGIFVVLTTSKNYEIWRVARGLQDKRSGF
jgi:hypothetical protein